MYRYKRHTKKEFEERIRRVEHLRNQGLNLKQISKKTGIAYSTVGKYVEKIVERRKAIKKELESDTLEDMALTISKKYKDLAKLCQSIANDTTKAPRDRLEASKVGIACENNLYSMGKSGILKVRNEKKKVVGDFGINE